MWLTLEQIKEVLPTDNEKHDYQIMANIFYIDNIPVIISNKSVTYVGKKDIDLVSKEIDYLVSK